RVSLGGRTEAIGAVAFSPDGKTLASGSRDDGTVKLWDLASNKVRFTLKGLKGQEEGTSVAFSKDGKTLAVAPGRFLGKEPGMVKLWDLPTEKGYAILKGHTGGVFAVAFSPDGELLATAGSAKANEGAGGEAKLWKVRRDQ